MSEAAPRFRQTAADMRREFDRTFAEPALPPASDLEAFLAIQVARRPFVLRVADLARLEPARPIVPLPGSRAGLLGLAGIQGRLTPVFQLANLLGLGAPTEAPRWIAVWDRGEPIGLAFEEFVGFVQASRADLIHGEAGERAGGPRTQAVRALGVVRPVIPLPVLLAPLRERPSAAR